MSSAENVSPPTQAARPYVCVHCPATFEKKAGLTKHNNDIHKPRMKCPHHPCKFRYSASRRHRLQEHLVKKHYFVSTTFSGENNNQQTETDIVTDSTHLHSGSRASISRPHNSHASSKAPSVKSPHCHSTPHQPASVDIPYNDTESFTSLRSTQPKTYLGDGQWWNNGYVGTFSMDYQTAERTIHDYPSTSMSAPAAEQSLGNPIQSGLTFDLACYTIYEGQSGARSFESQPVVQLHGDLAWNVEYDGFRSVHHGLSPSMPMLAPRQQLDIANQLLFAFGSAQGSRGGQHGVQIEDSICGDLSFVHPQDEDTIWDSSYDGFSGDVAQNGDDISHRY